MKKIRVVVVDDSALVRSLLAEIINRQRDMECVGAANDPLIAREMIRELNPDVITLDVEMPRMDGIDFLGRLMRLRHLSLLHRRRMGRAIARAGISGAGHDRVRRQPEREKPPELSDHGLGRARWPGRAPAGGSILSKSRKSGKRLSVRICVL